MVNGCTVSRYGGARACTAMIGPSAPSPIPGRRPGGATRGGSPTAATHAPTSARGHAAGGTPASSPTVRANPPPLDPLWTPSRPPIDPCSRPLTPGNPGCSQCR
eukprot:540955-Pyramimonas_sp.AAC.1